MRKGGGDKEAEQKVYFVVILALKMLIYAK